jgi:hypothetical protein
MCGGIPARGTTGKTRQAPWNSPKTLFFFGALKGRRPGAQEPRSRRPSRLIWATVLQAVSGKVQCAYLVGRAGSWEGRLACCQKREGDPVSVPVQLRT